MEGCQRDQVYKQGPLSRGAAGPQRGKKVVNSSPPGVGSAGHENSLQGEGTPSETGFELMT